MTDTSSAARQTAAASSGASAAPAESGCHRQHHGELRRIARRRPRRARSSRLRRHRRGHQLVRALVARLCRDVRRRAAVAHARRNHGSHARGRHDGRDAGAGIAARVGARPARLRACDRLRRGVVLDAGRAVRSHRTADSKGRWPDRRCRRVPEALPRRSAVHHSRDAAGQRQQDVFRHCVYQTGSA